MSNQNQNDNGIIKEKLKKYTMPPALENLEIKVGVLGNEAGIKGAVALFI